MTDEFRNSETESVSSPELGEDTAGLRQWSFLPEYRTGEADPIEKFYLPCMARSARYDRAVGFFRSTIFALVGQGTLLFVRNGGRMRFVCAPELTSEDLEALEGGYEQRESIIEKRLIETVDSMLSEAKWTRPVEILATLVSTGAMDLKVAIRPPSHGMYHEKLGVFTDRFDNAVSFKGSANETWHGWHDRGNMESIDVFCSWSSSTDSDRTRLHREYFERLWNDQLPQVSVVPFPEAARARLCRVAKDSVEALMQPTEGETGKRAPLPHQQISIENWEARGRRGIFEHATGSGKTYTAMIAIRRHLIRQQPTLVVVPSTLLLKQWIGELTTEFPAAGVLAVGGGNDLWRRPNCLESFTSQLDGLGERIVVATMQTASSPEFRSRVRDGPHLLLIADEVHQLGSPENSQLFDLNCGSRLGLSATPVRFGDPIGTAKIFDYFNGVVPPVVSLKDAIRGGRLVPYEYFPHPVHLSSSEAASWRKQTLVIAQEIARSSREVGGSLQLSARAKLLLIQRARIAKKAAAKNDLTVRVLAENFRAEQRWLVYCEDLTQLFEVKSQLAAAGIPASAYYAGMQEDGASTLQWLDKFGGVVLSIRCLDEGVDIPSVSHALILASSQNPRQFIQRRGRVLRTAPGKYLAVIHDAIVVPPNVEDEPEQTAMAKAELARALEFAQSATNLGAAVEIEGIANSIGLAFSSLTSVGLEDADEEQVD